jgi:hypothetical protein
MIDQTTVFILCTIGLMVTETILIFSVLKLNKNIKALNEKTQEYFGSLMEKVKGLVELFIAVQTNKLRQEQEKVKKK